MRLPRKPGAKEGGRLSKEGDKRVLQRSAIPENSPHPPLQRSPGSGAHPSALGKTMNLHVKPAITPLASLVVRAVLPAWWPDKGREAHPDSPFRPPGRRVPQRPVPDMAAEGDTGSHNRRPRRWFEYRRGLRWLAEPFGHVTHRPGPAAVGVGCGLSRLRLRPAWLRRADLAPRSVRRAPDPTWLLWSCLSVLRSLARRSHASTLRTGEAVYSLKGCLEPGVWLKGIWNLKGKKRTDTSLFCLVPQSLRQLVSKWNKSGA